MVATEGQLQNNSPEAACLDSQITVLVAPDRMSADLLVTVPSEGGKAATVEEVLAALGAAGVVHGIDMEVVEAAVARAQQPPDPTKPLERVKVATGTEPGAGTDARIDYHPCLTEAGGRPKVQPDGTVNLFDLNLVRNIPKDTVLAVMTPPTRGEPGRTVTGTEIQGRMGREVWLKAGKGTILSEDKLTVTAAVDGHATLVYGEITVTNVYEVNKDVGVETGNIEFIGSVVVRGSIRPGFHVKAEGDVEVQDGIDGGSVDAAGSVTVQYGITGSGRSKVVAGGAVKARFIESAEVRAGGHVWAAEGILQSRVEAGAGVEVLGRRGAIIGGHVTAKNSVAARNLGSEMGGYTEITVGIMPEIRQELMEIQKKLAEVESDFLRTDQAIQFLTTQHRLGGLSQEKRTTLARLVQVQEQLFSRQEQLKARKQELEQQSREAKNAWVQAKDCCYPGVRVTIGPAHFQTTDALQRAKFRLNQDLEVEVVPA